MTMTPVSPVRTIAALVCGLLIGGVMSSPASAQGSPATEKKEAYVSPGADKRGLINEPLHGVAGQQVSVDHYTFPPGWVGGRHYHTGPVYVYVLEGSLTMDEHGKARQTFKPGDLYREPIGTPMQARNLSAVEPLKALVIQVTRKGEPLMIKAD